MIRETNRKRLLREDFVAFLALEIIAFEDLDAMIPVDSAALDADLTREREDREAISPDNLETFLADFIKDRDDCEARSSLDNFDAFLPDVAFAFEDLEAMAPDDFDAFFADLAVALDDLETTAPDDR